MRSRTVRAGVAGFLASLATIGAGAAFAAASSADPGVASCTIRVLDPRGAPLAGASVRCSDPSGEARLADAAGSVLLPASCQQVECASAEHLPGEARVESGARTDCAVKPAVRIAAELASPCTARCVAQLTRPDGTVAERVPIEASPVASGERTAQEARFPLQPPGRYRLEVQLQEARQPDEDPPAWRCVADLGLLGPGRQQVVVPWRGPVAVTGTVVDAQQKPLAGVPVRAFAGRPFFHAPWEPPPSEAHRWTCAPGRAVEAVSGVGGAFRVATDPSVETLVVAGGVNDPRGFAAATVRSPGESLVLAPRPGAHVAGSVVYGGDRAPPPACRLVLTPDDPDAEWIAQALGAPLKVETDPSGAFSIGPFRPASFEIEATPRPGIFVRRREPAPPAGRTVDLGAVEVSRGAGAEVLVTDESGAPVAGATVKARGSAGLILSVKATTGADGRAFLEGLPAGSRILLEAHARGYRPAYVGEQAIEKGPFRVTLEPGAIVAGWVSAPWGDPIAGATVEGVGTPIGRTTSGDDGAFELDEAPPGALRLTARAEGFRSAAPVEVSVAAGEERRDLDLVLEPAPGLAGRIVTPDGRPAAGARVDLVREWDVDNLDLVAPQSSVVTDGTGRFQLPVEPDSWARLVARAPGFGPAVAGALPSKVGEEITLTLSEPCRLAATLPAGLPGDARLAVIDGAGVGRSLVAAGRLRVEVGDLAPGDGSAGLARSLRRTVRLIAGQTADVALNRGSMVEGTVTADGVPVPSAFVGLGTVTAKRVRPGPTSGFTDALGRFTFDGLAAGPYLVFSESPAGRAEANVLVPEEGTITIDLAVERVVLLAQVVDEATKEPVAAAASLVPRDFTGRVIREGFEAFPEGAPGFRNIVSNCACDSAGAGLGGVIRLVVPQPGPYRLTVDATGYRTAESVIELKRGDNQALVSLARRPIRSVRITLATDAPRAYGMVLGLASGEAACVHFTEGPVSCDDVPAGPMEFYYSVQGWGIGRATVDVPPEGDVELTLRAGRGGELIVPVDALESPMPTVRGEDGLDWSVILRRTHAPWRGDPMRAAEVSGIGPAWVFSDLPPGRYTAIVGGAPRAAVEVAPGGRAVAR